MSSILWEVPQTSSRLTVGRALFLGAAAGALVSASVAASFIQSPIFSVLRALSGATPQIEWAGGLPAWRNLPRAHWRGSSGQFPVSAWAPAPVVVEPTPVSLSSARKPSFRIARKAPAIQRGLVPSRILDDRAPVWVASFDEEVQRLSDSYRDLCSRFIRLARGETVDSLPSVLVKAQLKTHPEVSAPAMSTQVQGAAFGKRAQARVRPPHRRVSRLSVESRPGRPSATETVALTTPIPSIVTTQSAPERLQPAQMPSPSAGWAAHAGILMSLDSEDSPPRASQVAALSPTAVSSQAEAVPAPEIFARVSSVVLRAQVAEQAGPRVQVSIAQPAAAPVTHPVTLKEGEASPSVSRAEAPTVAALTSQAEIASSTSVQMEDVSPWVASEAFAPRRQDVAIQTVVTWAGEGLDASVAHSTWNRIHAPGYLDTLEYSARGVLTRKSPVPSSGSLKAAGSAPGNRLPPLPLVSENSARFLAARAGMELQEGLGTVILRTASGWKPQVSGVSSAALELSEELSVLSRDQRVAGEKTWIWFNVSPTFQMLRLAHTSGQRAFASLPVVSDTVTWMDAVEIKSEALRGRIFAASSARAQGVARAELRIPGEAVAVATTDAHGRFQLKEWFRVGNHPVDLEVWSRDDYPNRYRTFPSADQPLTVFFFDSKAVRAWTDQLQGGLSSAGGLLIGAAGDFVSRQSLQGDAVYPDVRSLSSAAMLKPETYTVSSQDQLLVHRPLDVYAPRYLGVQLPEGPVDVALLTQEGKELRRELIISSPGVVNVLSPR